MVEPWILSAIWMAFILWRDHKRSADLRYWEERRARESDERQQKAQQNHRDVMVELMNRLHEAGKDKSDG